MELAEVAQPRRWSVPDNSLTSGDLIVAGWEFGGLDAGSAKPVALLHHANGLCAATWALVATALAEKFHVFAIDTRGHGDSSQLAVPQDYHWDNFVSDNVHVAQQVLAETGQSSIALGVGNSMGAIVTAGAQARHGQLYDQIVMLDPPIHATAEIVAAMDLTIEPEPGGRREQLVTQSLRRRAVWSTREEARAAWQDKPLFASWDPMAFDLYIQEGFADLPDGQVKLKCDPTVESHIFSTNDSRGVLEYGPRVAVPVHLVYAEYGYFHAEFFREIAGLFPRGEFLQMQGGHLLPLEVPELVAQYLLALAEDQGR